MDPAEPVDLPEGEDDLNEELRKLIKQYWSMIKTGHRLKHKLQDIYNYRMREGNLQHMVATLREDIFEKQAHNFKLNASFGFILRNMESGQMRFFHSSHNEGRLFDTPRLIKMHKISIRLWRT